MIPVGAAWGASRFRWRMSRQHAVSGLRGDRLVPWRPRRSGGRPGCARQSRSTPGVPAIRQWSRADRLAVGVVEGRHGGDGLRVVHETHACIGRARSASLATVRELFVIFAAVAPARRVGRQRGGEIRGAPTRTSRRPPTRVQAREAGVRLRCHRRRSCSRASRQVGADVVALAGGLRLRGSAAAACCATLGVFGRRGGTGVTMARGKRTEPPGRLAGERAAALITSAAAGAQTASAAGAPRVSGARLGLRIGAFEPGPFNAITDVDGVRVGHELVLRGDDVRTGVTAIIPGPGNLYTAPRRPGSTSATATASSSARPRCASSASSRRRSCSPARCASGARRTRSRAGSTNSRAWASTRSIRSSVRPTTRASTTWSNPIGNRAGGARRRHRRTRRKPRRRRHGHPGLRLQGGIGTSSRVLPEELGAGPSACSCRPRRLHDDRGRAGVEPWTSTRSAALRAGRRRRREDGSIDRRGHGCPADGAPARTAVDHGARTHGLLRERRLRRLRHRLLDIRTCVTADERALFWWRSTRPRYRRSSPPSPRRRRRRSTHRLAHTTVTSAQGTLEAVPKARWRCCAPRPCLRRQTRAEPQNGFAHHAPRPSIQSARTAGRRPRRAAARQRRAGARRGSRRRAGPVWRPGCATARRSGSAPSSSRCRRRSCGRGARARGGGAAAVTLRQAGHPCSRCRSASCSPIGARAPRSNFLSDISSSPSASPASSYLLVCRPTRIEAWDAGDPLADVTASEPWQPLPNDPLREALDTPGRRRTGLSRLRALSGRTAGTRAPPACRRGSRCPESRRCRRRSCGCCSPSPGSWRS